MSSTPPPPLETPSTQSFSDAEEESKPNERGSMAFILHNLPRENNALERSTPEAVGHELYCVEMVTLEPRKVTPVPLGFSLIPPRGYYGQILSKSTWALKNIIVVGGVIDPDFRGELCALMLNLNDEPILWDEGVCCAQLVFLKCCTPAFRQFKMSDFETERGERGCLQLHKKIKMDEKAAADAKMDEDAPVANGIKKGEKKTIA
jgi:dUTP pyrophosphatase